MLIFTLLLMLIILPILVKWWKYSLNFNQMQGTVFKCKFITALIHVILIKTILFHWDKNPIFKKISHFSISFPLSLLSIVLDLGKFPISNKRTSVGMQVEGAGGDRGKWDCNILLECGGRNEGSYSTSLGPLPSLKLAIW